MEKEILGDIRKEISELQTRLEDLIARLDKIEKECADCGVLGGEPFTEPVSLDIDLAGAEISAFVEQAPATVEEMPELDCKWMKDECGKKLSNIISGIALNDRLAIINILCGEDPIVFQEMIGRLNDCQTFAQAVKYITDSFPAWNLDSAPVYCLMMAVRRKFV